MVVYGAPDPKAGSCDTLYQIPSDTRLNHRAIVLGGVLADRCGAILTEFFRKKRDMGKKWTGQASTIRLLQRLPIQFDAQPRPVGDRQEPLRVGPERLRDQLVDVRRRRQVLDVPRHRQRRRQVQVGGQADRPCSSRAAPSWTLCS